MFRTPRVFARIIRNNNIGPTFLEENKRGSDQHSHRTTFQKRTESLWQMKGATQTQRESPRLLKKYVPVQNEMSDCQSRIPSAIAKQVEDFTKHKTAKTKTLRFPNNKFTLKLTKTKTWISTTYSVTLSVGDPSVKELRLIETITQNYPSLEMTNVGTYKTYTFAASEENIMCVVASLSREDDVEGEKRTMPAVANQVNTKKAGREKKRAYVKRAAGSIATAAIGGAMAGVAYLAGSRNPATCCRADLTSSTQQACRPSSHMSHSSQHSSAHGVHLPGIATAGAAFSLLTPTMVPMLANIPGQIVSMYEEPRDTFDKIVKQKRPSTEDLGRLLSLAKEVEEEEGARPSLMIKGAREKIVSAAEQLLKESTEYIQYRMSSRPLPEVPFFSKTAKDVYAKMKSTSMVVAKLGPLKWRDSAEETTGKKGHEDYDLVARMHAAMSELNDFDTQQSISYRLDRQIPSDIDKVHAAFQNAASRSLSGDGSDPSFPRPTIRGEYLQQYASMALRQLREEERKEGPVDLTKAVERVRSARDDIAKLSPEDALLTSLDAALSGPSFALDAS